MPERLPVKQVDIQKQGYVVPKNYIHDYKNLMEKREFTIAEEILPNGDLFIYGRHADEFAGDWKASGRDQLDMARVSFGPPTAETPTPIQLYMDGVSGAYYKGWRRKGSFGEKLIPVPGEDGAFIVTVQNPEAFAGAWERDFGDHLSEYTGNEVVSTGGKDASSVSSPGEGEALYTDEVPEGLPGIKLRTFNDKTCQLELTEGARAYLGKVGLVNPTEGIIIKGSDKNIGPILDALQKGRYNIDIPGLDFVSKVRSAVPLDGDERSAVLWVTAKQRMIVDALLKAKGDLAAIGDNVDNVELKGLTEQFYESCLIALVGPPVPSGPTNMTLGSISPAVPDPTPPRLKHRSSLWNPLKLFRRGKKITLNPPRPIDYSPSGPPPVEAPFTKEPTEESAPPAESEPPPAPGKKDGARDLWNPPLSPAPERTEVPPPESIVKSENPAVPEGDLGTTVAERLVPRGLKQTDELPKPDYNF